MHRGAIVTDLKVAVLRDIVEQRRDRHDVPLRGQLMKPFQDAVADQKTAGRLAVRLVEGRGDAGAAALIGRLVDPQRKTTAAQVHRQPRTDQKLLELVPGQTRLEHPLRKAQDHASNEHGLVPQEAAQTIVEVVDESTIGCASGSRVRGGCVAPRARAAEVQWLVETDDAVAATRKRAREPRCEEASRGGAADGELHASLRHGST